MALSIFTEKEKSPMEKELSGALDVNYKLWKELREFVLKEYPAAVEEWKYSGKNYGWGFRLRDKKRAIIYMTPCDKYFLASLVFGEAASKEALNSKISDNIKKIITDVKVYAEGRGIRIEVKNSKILNDIKILVKIKLGS
jgi:hypothetical protein